MSKAKQLLDWFRSGKAQQMGARLLAIAAAPVAGAAAAMSGVPIMSGQRRRQRAQAGEAIMSRMLGGWGGFGQYPGSWTANRIEQIQHYRHWVWKCINLIMVMATKEPPMICDVYPNDGKERFREKRRLLTCKDFGNSPSMFRKAMQTLRPHETIEHVEDDHQLVSLMNRPNEWDTGAMLIQEAIMYGELCGIKYIWPVPYTNAPGIAELWVMPSHWVWPQRTGQTNQLVDYYEVRPWGQTAGAVPFTFDASEFIVDLYKSPLSKIDGCSPLQAGSEIVDTYEQVQLARYYSIQNGANIGTVLELDAGLDPSEPKIQRFLAQFKAKYQGMANFNEPGMMPPGVTLNRPDGPAELAMGSTAEQCRDFVIGLWGLTKSVLGFMEDANRASFEAALAQCFYLVVNPRLSSLGTLLTEKLAKPNYGRTKKIFWRDLTPADRATELQEWNALKGIAPYKGNEFRQWMGLEPLPEGEEGIQAMQIGAAGAMADPYGAVGGDEPPEAPGGGMGFGKRWMPSTNGVH